MTAPLLIPSTDIETVNAAVTVLCELEGQRHLSVCDMASAMLGDLTTFGALGPLDGYVKMFCTVLDAREDTGPIVARILEGVHVQHPGRPS